MTKSNGKSFASSDASPRTELTSGSAALEGTQCLDGCSRLFGLGIFVTLGIILGIASSTIWNGWISPLGLLPHGPVELIGFCVEVSLLLWSYLSASFLGPGFVPRAWQPTKEEFEELLGPVEHRPLAVVPRFEDCLQFCVPCGGFKPPRAHHCSSCGRCVLWMDHHCPWTNTCVGHRNLKAFMLFVRYVPVACLHSLIIHSELLVLLGWVWYEKPSSHFWFYVLQVRTLIVGTCWVAGLVVMFFVGTLACDMHSTALHNQSMIEEMMVERAESRRRAAGERDLVFPYDLGARRNREMVFGRDWLRAFLPVNGVACSPYWPTLRQGCGHFDLSTEMLVQKASKLSRSKVVPVTTAFAPKGCRSKMPCLLCCELDAGAACSCEGCGDRMLHVQPGERLVVARLDGRQWVHGRVLYPDATAAADTEGPPGWIPTSILKLGEAKKYEVPHQQELQGPWEAQDGRTLRIHGVSARTSNSWVPYVIRAKNGSAELLGCTLQECDGKVAKWSNGEVWMRPGTKISGETTAS